jgi:uncharacterized protein YjbI with pentapeptide repeats
MLCVFHDPETTKEIFWKHLASYIRALRNLPEAAGGTRPSASPESWIEREWDLRLSEEYGSLLSDFLAEDAAGGWGYMGFTFPSMDREHSFSNQQVLAPSFRDATFAGQATFSHAHFSDSADFSGAVFSGRTDFAGAVFRADADLRYAQFKAELLCNHTTFKHDVDIRYAVFGGGAYFEHALLAGRAFFVGASFQGRASFDGTKLKSDVWFAAVSFNGVTTFRDVVFSGNARFPRADFRQVAVFTSATFEGGASFAWSAFRHTVDFVQITLKGDLALTDVRLSEDSRVLFWGVNFGRPAGGTGDSRTSGSESGRILIVRPHGGMHQMSFLRSDIAYGYSRVSLAGIQWLKVAPAPPLMDLALSEAEAQDELERLLPPSDEDYGRFYWFGRAARARQHSYFDILCELLSLPAPQDDMARMMGDVVRFEDVHRALVGEGNRVLAEVEQCVRGTSGDAEVRDFRVAVMDHNRSMSSGLARRWLSIRRAVSLYGEAPRRMLLLLAVVMGLSALGYMFAGVRFHGEIIQRHFAFEPTQLLATVRDFARTVLYAVDYLLSLQLLKEPWSEPTADAALLVGVAETILGVFALAEFHPTWRRWFDALFRHRVRD